MTGVQFPSGELLSASVEYRDELEMKLREENLMERGRMM
jgi:hypothetical protein